jgi:hypothetical protein
VQRIAKYEVVVDGRLSNVDEDRCDNIVAKILLLVCTAAKLTKRRVLYRVRATYFAR